MEYFSSARDFYYTNSAVSSLDYYIEVDGSAVYFGKAFRTSGETELRINISRRVRDYLQTNMPDFREYDGVVVPHPLQMRIFTLRNSLGMKLGQYTVLLESTGDWSAYYGVITDPINGKADPRQKLFWTTVEELDGAGDDIDISDSGDTPTWSGACQDCCSNIPVELYDLSANTVYSPYPMQVYRTGSTAPQLYHYETDEDAQANGFPAAGYYAVGYSGGTSTSDRRALFPLEANNSSTPNAHIESGAKGAVTVDYSSDGGDAYELYVEDLVFPDAKELDIRFEGAYGANRLEHINADSATKVRLYSWLLTTSDLPYKKPSNLKSVCFPNVREIDIAGLVGYTDNVFALEKVDLPNAETIRINLSKARTVTCVNAPKACDGSLRLDSNPITEIYLPTIGDDGFHYLDVLLSNCSGLTTAEFGPYITVGESTFYKCTSLPYFNNSYIQSALSIGDYVELEPNICEDGAYVATGFFEKCSSLEGVRMLGLKCAGYQCFKDCTALTGVTLPNLVELMDFAFDGCSSLTDVFMPKLDSIGVSPVFRGCSSLTSLTLYNNRFWVYNNFGGGMFSGCTNLTEINFPNLVYFLFDSNTYFNGCTATALNFGALVGLGYGDRRQESDPTWCDTFLLPTTLTSLYLPDTLELLNLHSIVHSPNLTVIQYGGTKAMFSQIEIWYRGRGDEYSTDRTWTVNCLDTQGILTLHFTGMVPTFEITFA